jgi:predicted transcriptional regulator
MAKKQSDKETKSKLGGLKKLINAVVNEGIDLPDNALVFLDTETALQIFTKKRLELVRLINAKKPCSAQELVKLTKRKKQAVNRDLKILEQHEIIRLEKKGRTVKPKIYRQAILFPLINLESKENYLQRAHINGENTKQKMAAD